MRSIDKLFGLPVLEEIRAERIRQIEEEGWSAAHDDMHADEDLIDAAQCYLSSALGEKLPTRSYDSAPRGWPWAEKWWKPKDARRDLVRAGALCLADQDYWRRNRPGVPPQVLPQQMLEKIVAEIERLDRADGAR